MNAAEDTTFKPQTRTSIAEELIGQELFLFDRQHQTAYCLNSGAALIWFLCDGTHNLESIATEIAVASARSEQQILPEVLETVAEFQLLELLEV
jgi:hypothetical protein